MSPSTWDNGPGCSRRRRRRGASAGGIFCGGGVVKFAVTVGIALLVVAGGVPGPVWAGAAAQRFTIVPAESQAIYRVEETLFREGNRLKVAVGSTNAVRGDITVDRANPRNSRIGTIVVNISTFRTDSTRRDRAIRERWLESARYPNAEFHPVAFSGLPARYTHGQEISFKVTGDLKIRDVVRRTTLDVRMRLNGNTLRGTAAGKILMTDFGFDPPSILGILRAENTVEIEPRFVARPAS